ncbi:MAG: bifunctional transaldolase/phosoglucose isomerase [Anaerolineae bacterium]
MTKLRELAGLGQAIWFDYIRRSFITSGELQRLIDDGLRGVTSNPSIFEKAIAGSTDYDEDLHRLVDEGKTVEEIYEALALDDISRAADLLRPVYDQTDGADGYVSLEVSPTLAHDTEGTVAEARRLFATLGRPNVMIKVPATPAGIPAIETLIGEGINVNVTLMFSLAHYDAVAEAYLAGLEKLAAASSRGPARGAGGDLSRVASVASFFVSRVDTAVDRALDEARSGDQPQQQRNLQSPIPNLQYPISNTQSLQGKIAVANAKIAYARFRQVFSGARWQKLAAQGARVQRPLWASTSTKNPLYPDTLYVDALIGPDTVNTVPPATLNAFFDHGAVASTLEAGLNEAREQLAQLAEIGIDLDAITQQLQDNGVAGFAKSFETLMASIAEKRERLLAGWQHHAAFLGAYQPTVDAALAEMAEDRVLARIWAHDHTVWKPDPTEITNRLGWLHIAEALAEDVGRLESLADAVRAHGYTDVLLLGMGGSSLAPEVFSKTFVGRIGNSSHKGVGAIQDGQIVGRIANSPYLAVLDSTDPAAVLAQAERLDPTRTLFIVATKSGGTVETLSFFKYFYNQVAGAVGADRAGQHFVAITDPGSKLERLAERYRFRATFLNDPNIGGRYSALSYFGLAPAALVGVDVSRLLDRALAMSCGCESCVTAQDNPGAWLGAIMGELAKSGRDKVTIVTSPEIASFGDWVKQLIAESTGKDGRGILPVVGEPLGPPEVYGDDRVFVFLEIRDSEIRDWRSETAPNLQYPIPNTQYPIPGLLENAGHPVVRFHLHDRYDLGGQFFLWEMATAVAGHRLGINPFDQPNVESAKVRAREMVAAYQKEGTLPEVESAPLTAEELDAFLAGAEPGAYIALQAYVQPTPEADAALLALRTRLRDRTKLATTVGYGPRFLHSTGQLHKGDAGKGLFIQFTADDPRDVPIPDEAGSPESSITFGVLKAAQALGDRQALLDAGRQVIRFHLKEDVVGGLKQLTEGL